VVTLATTTTLGACWTVLVRTDEVTSLSPYLSPATVAGVWGDRALLVRGLEFATAALFILLVHELGHWFACRHHRLDVTPPLFLPAPLGLGTFGAFIRIRSPIRDKRELLDVGVSGPLAGFVALLPVLAAGVALSHPARLAEAARFGEPVLLYRPGDSLLLELLTRIFHGALPAGTLLEPHPLLLAGWVGLFATMLNLLPLAQLDGGHILYAVLGGRQRRVARVLWLGLVGLGFLWPGWWLWALFVLVLGLRHPRIVDESKPLDRRERRLAGLSLVVFVIGFMPAPIQVLEITPAPSFGAGSVASRLEVEQQRDRSLVDQLDAHRGAEAAALHLDAEARELVAEGRDQRLGDLRLRRALEGGPAAAIGAGEERELGDEQQAAADLGQRPVHPPALVVEDPQAGELGGRAAHHLEVVPGRHADQRDEAAPHRSHFRALHFDAGPRNSL